MATFFPQINSGNFTMTQLPYTSGNAYETVVQDIESGPRFTFPRRGSGLTGYPYGPLFSGVLNYTNITDAEVATLRTFFDSMHGRYGRFSFADPGGNLFQYSENFAVAYWGTGPGQGSPDPYGHLLGSASGAISATVFAATKGPASAMVVNSSLYCYATTNSQSVTITIASSLGTFTRIVRLPTNSWLRADFNAQISGSGAVTSGFSGFTGYMFGAQCVPMKGPGGYVKSPGKFGYRENCRFDIDSFDLVMLGPNQNQVRLPVVEMNV